KRFDNCPAIETAGMRRADGESQRAGRDFALTGFAPQHDHFGRTVAQAAGRTGEPAIRVDDDPYGISALDPAHRQKRIIAEDRAHADHNSIHHGAEAVQVIERRRAADIFAFSRGKRDPAVKRLSELPDHKGPVSGRPAYQIERMLNISHYKTG